MKVCLNLTNLLIFVFLFCAASFNFYLINFYLKYLPGDIYTNSIVASVAEFVSHITSGWVVIKIGPARGIGCSFFLATLSATVLALAGQGGWITPVAVLGGKFGTGSAFTMLYMSTLHYFPSRFMGRVFGVCNVSARFCTIGASMVAESASPTPESVIIIFCMLAAIATAFLRRPENKHSKALELARLAVHKLNETINFDT